MKWGGKYRQSPLQMMLLKENREIFFRLKKARSQEARGERKAPSR
jgi:hypothetical protein